MRLAGGPSEQQGRLEVQLVGNNSWLGVCSWSTDWVPLAQVVCRWLGFTGGVMRSGGWYGTAGQLGLADLVCSPGAADLNGCSFAAAAARGCTEMETVGLACDGEACSDSLSRQQTPKRGIGSGAGFAADGLQHGASAVLLHAFCLLCCAMHPTCCAVLCCAALCCAVLCCASRIPHPALTRTAKAVSTQLVYRPFPHIRMTSFAHPVQAQLT